MILAHSNGSPLSLFSAVQIKANNISFALYSEIQDSLISLTNEMVDLPLNISLFSFGEMICRHPDKDSNLHLIDRMDIKLDDLDSLVNHRTLGPCSSLYIAFDESRCKILPPYNKMAESYLTKDNGGQHINKIQKNIIAQILLPFSDDVGDNFVVRFTVNENLGFWASHDAEQIENSQDSYHDFAARLMPRLKVDNTSLHVNSQDKNLIGVQLVDANGVDLNRPEVKIYAKCDAGYLAKREMETDADGRVNFPFFASGLEDGDEATIEVGFKWFSNIANCQMQVTR